MDIQYSIYMIRYNGSAVVSNHSTAVTGYTLLLLVWMRLDGTYVDDECFDLAD